MLEFSWLLVRSDSQRSWKSFSDKSCSLPLTTLWYDISFFACPFGQLYEYSDQAEHNIYLPLRGKQAQLSLILAHPVLSCWGCLCLDWEVFKESWDIPRRLFSTPNRPANTPIPPQNWMLSKRLLKQNEKNSLSLFHIQLKWEQYKDNISLHWFLWNVLILDFILATYLKFQDRHHKILGKLVKAQTTPDSYSTRK